jgi:rubrerythrin
LGFVQGNVGDTEANIRKALFVEEFVSVKMFPTLEKIAREKGDKKLADFFAHMAQGEAEHAKALREALEIYKARNA